MAVVCWPGKWCDSTATCGMKGVQISATVDSGAVA